MITRSDLVIYPTSNTSHMLEFTMKISLILKPRQKNYWIFTMGLVSVIVTYMTCPTETTSLICFSRALLMESPEQDQLMLVSLWIFLGRWVVLWNMKKVTKTGLVYNWPKMLFGCFSKNSVHRIFFLWSFSTIPPGLWFKAILWKIWVLNM